MSAARVTGSAAGLDVLRRKLRQFPDDAQAAVGAALRAIVETAADDLRAGLPADVGAGVRVDAIGDAGARLSILSGRARDLEFGTGRTAAGPLLRPVAAAAAERARVAVASVLAQAIDGEAP